MQSPDPTGHRQTQPKTGCPHLPAPDAIFQGFRPPTGHPAQLFNEIWDLRRHGLNKDLRFTLLAVARETVGEAAQRGSSTCDFVAVSWGRWMERLELRSINAVKARMARLEEMGLVEVLYGECGPMGATAPRFRLRWADGGAAFGTLAAPLQDLKQNPGPWERPGADAHPANPRQNDTHQTDTRQNDTHQADTHQADTHQTDTHQADTHQTDTRQNDTHQTDTRQNDTHQFETNTTDTHQTDSHSIKQNRYIYSINSNQSINPSIIEVNELIEKMTIELNSINSNQNQSFQYQHCGTTDRTGEVCRPTFDVSPWLRGEFQEPWPEPLRQGLGEILDPHRIPGLFKRSPWTGEGAWAILQAIRAKGRNLGNQGGTLWNALLQMEKGTFWLTHAGPMLRQAGWQMEPEDGTPMATGARAEGACRLAQMGFSRMPLHGAALERHQRLRHEAVRRERAMDLDFGEDLDDDEDQSPSAEEPMTQGPELEIVKRAEDLSPEVKAELRTSIETFRDVTRAAVRSPAANRPGGFDDVSRSWKHIVEVLEPMLPLQINLLDAYRPVAIRQRSQIKMNVVEAVYRAVS